jgi:hypothetical protein
LHFPSPTATTKTRVGRPFTRSSSHKENAETEIILKASIPKKVKYKSDNVGKPIEIMNKNSIQKKDKGKGEANENHVEVINISTPLIIPTSRDLSDN